MAVDEALLEAAIDGGPATLRIYQWQVPTLSLGYFQRYDDRCRHAASLDCAVVRRQSGGGAILHDHELTYSLALPPGHPLSRDAGQLYSAVHRVLVKVLASRRPGSSAAWSLRIVPNGKFRLPAEAEPFLCFQRRAPGDVLLVPAAEDPRSSSGAPDGTGNWKIIGSAQRRRGGAILQHGSVLLERSAASPELPGWGDLTGVPIHFAALADEFSRQFASETAVPIAATSLPTAICDAARRIEQAKYADRAWTTRR
jgi:lipoate-protein ligase A